MQSVSVAIDSMIGISIMQLFDIVDNTFDTTHLQSFSNFPEIGTISFTSNFFFFFEILHWKSIYFSKEKTINEYEQ